MDSDELVCPHCGERIQLSQALQGQMEKALVHERAKLVAAAEKRLRESMNAEVEDIRTELAEKSRKLEEARTAELALRKRERALVDEKKELELAVEKRLSEEKVAIQESLTKQLLEAHRLKDAEKDKMVEDLRAQLESAHRKAEQGSQQMQGEVLELDLEATLRETFPFDEVVPVAKGVRGGDVFHRVMTRSGTHCGTILWESKRTKNWSDSWVEKLKGDQRSAKADVAAIVSEVLPKDVGSFAVRDDVWVCNRATFVPVAVALRNQLTQISFARNAAAHKDQRIEGLYRYLTSSEFKQRLEGIVEAFMSMRSELEKEKRATLSRWAKQEKQIDAAMTAASGTYGDMKGILGPSMQGIPALEDGIETGPAPGDPAA